MAVVRIKASKQWFRRAAVEAKKTMPRLARELSNAKGRPGLTAELTLDEAERLAEFMPEDALIRTAVTTGREALVRERARHKQLQDYLDRRRRAE